MSTTTTTPPLAASHNETRSTVDVEQTLSQHSPIINRDPYKLSNGIISPDKLDQWKSSNHKRAADYHHRQNELIGNLLKPMDELAEDARADVTQHALAVKIAVVASFVANVCLGGVQVWASVSAKSLSLLATGVDSIFDITTNGLLWWCHWKAARLDREKWPVGGERLETIGNIVFGSLMCAVNLVVAVESLRSIISHGPKDPDTNVFFAPALIGVGCALGVKVLLFLYCFSLRNKDSQIRMLWQDHRNDLFLNGFGIIMSAGGSRLKWFIDPIGGIIISLAIIASWSRTSYKQFSLLAGRAAPHEFLQLVIYKASTFAPEIEKLDTARAYHSGPDYFVEVDIVMDAQTPLWKAHDVSQALQDKLETLPRVARAFVHVDYETEHRPEHGKYERHSIEEPPRVPSSSGLVRRMVTKRPDREEEHELHDR